MVRSRTPLPGTAPASRAAEEGTAPISAGAVPSSQERTPPTARTNLPVQLTSFIGREREQGEVRALLATARLVTLTGTGGVGKTRLALAVAAELVGENPEGVWLVELAPLADPALVAPAAALALGIREEPATAAAAGPRPERTGATPPGSPDRRGALAGSP